MDSENAARTNFTVSNPKPTFTVPTSPKQMDVAMETSGEKYPTSLALTGKYVFDITKTRLEQLCDKFPSLSVNDDVESSV